MDWTLLLHLFGTKSFKFVHHVLFSDCSVRTAINSNNRCFDEMTLGHPKTKSSNCSQMKRSRAGKKKMNTNQSRPKWNRLAFMHLPFNSAHNSMQ